MNTPPARWHALIRRHCQHDALWGKDQSRTRHTTALLIRLPDHRPDTPLPRIKEHLHSRPAAGLHILRQ